MSKRDDSLLIGDIIESGNKILDYTASYLLKSLYQIAKPFPHGIEIPRENM